MLRSATLLAGLLLATPALAAKDPCKGVSIKKDAFGDNRVLEAGDLKLTKAGDKWAFNASFGAGGGYGGFTALTFDPIPAGSTVDVLLADQSIVQVQTIGVAMPQTVAIMGIVSQKYALPISLTTDQVKAISGQEIKAIRVLKVTGETWYVGEISGGDAKKFMEAAACMATT